MEPLEDEQLVLATLRGDSSAFEGLVERYQKPLYNAAFRITGSRDDALEATTRSETVTFSGKLESGQVLGGRYRIRSLLGRGGMGEVWRAFDLKLRVDVTL